jgi:hypothetical protein
MLTVTQGEPLPARSGLARTLLAVTALVWLASSLLVLAGAFVLVNSAEDTCSYADNGYDGGGASSWSWFPLGRVCRYTGSQTGTHTDNPSHFVWATLLLLAVVPLATWGGWLMGRAGAVRAPHAG